MKSKTKRYISEAKIKEIFAYAKLGEVSDIRSLDAGEFNCAYFVLSNGKDYVIKIAPNSEKYLLTYEKNLMAREIAFYRLIQNNTTVKTPEIFFYDDSKSIIDSSYFIMEKLNSKPLNNCKLSKKEKQDVYLKVGEAVAKLHTITGEAFGYEQNGLHENWYLAIRSMVSNLINDCENYKKQAKDGLKLLKYIDKYKELLFNVKAAYTHFDIWDGNIFYQKHNNETEITIIDTERGFWGDGIADFVNIEMFSALKRKKSIVAYNKIANTPITFTEEENIRYNIMRAYLGLIVYTEKFARYKIRQIKYLINLFFAKYLFITSFKALNKF